MEIAIACLMVAVGYTGSALYSGLETGAYSLNRVRLHVLSHREGGRADRLQRLIANPSVLLGTLLIGNNLMNYLGTGGLTLLLKNHGVADGQVIVINVLVTTTLLFVFGETLPKDLFAAHADRLMYPFARFLTLSRWAFTVCGVLPLISFLSRIIMRAAGQGGAVAFHPRRLVTELTKEGLGSGLLSSEQSAMIDRVLAAGKRRVRDEMVPWGYVVRVRRETPAEQLRELAERSGRSRWPVVDDRDEPVGILHVLDLLRHAPAPALCAADLMRPQCSFDAETPIRSALRQMQQAHEPIAIVTQAAQPVGVVTFKDLVEPLTGELASW